MVIISKTEYVTVLGGSHYFWKTTSFGFLNQCVRTALVFTLKKNKGLMRTIMGIRFFPKNFFWFSSLVVLINSKTINFLCQFSQARSQIFFFEIFLNYFFDKKIDFEYIFNNLSIQNFISFKSSFKLF